MYPSVHCSTVYNSHGSNVNVHGWITDKVYVYAVEHYSATKWNEIESFVETWMVQESVIQSKVCQKEKNEYILMHICRI